jgi:hypothetical protein
MGRDALAIVRPFGRLVHSRMDFANFTNRFHCVLRTFDAVAKSAEIATAVT